MEVSPSYNTEKIARDLVSHRTADQLSLYHDRPFSAFSTEVFYPTNQKRNRSSSPFTTLAEQAERKVVTVGERSNFKIFLRTGKIMVMA